ncbi:MAG: hypothetical protein A2X36_04320 [Elusimicrobia bacterium GWA2_69_24]|nr:MAG: hypothetical protein A2X36_04320 [Elusimicrobia bacterium GWA2_69_24]HBL16282.1 hypothetical protein [Elusimicrobiota bacterium]
MSDKRIDFTWDIIHRCNYRCRYCWFDGKWEGFEREFPEYPSAEKWIAAWKRVHERCGEVNIDVLGGEPLLFPGFIPMIGQLSRWHRVGVTTNMYLKMEQVEALAAVVDPSRVCFGVSFHPDYAEFEDVRRKADFLKRSGVNTTVHVVAYPPFLERLEGWYRACEESDLRCKVWPFMGTWEGKSYPQSYSEEERHRLGRLLGSLEQRDYVVDRKNTRGRACYSGCVYATVKPNGEVYRCGGAGELGRVGNLFDADFRMWEAPTPCPVEHCVCEEFQYLADRYEVRRRVGTFFESLVWLGNSGVLVDGPTNIYIDPFEVSDAHKHADLILITHPHYDHCSLAGIARVLRKETVIAAPPDVLRKLHLPGVALRPGDEKILAGIKVRALPAYGTKKRYHPKEKGWLGYLVTVQGKTLYHAGDCEEIEEIHGLAPDIALLPVDDIYNTGAFDAAKTALTLRASMAAPLHYWPVCGLESDAEAFVKHCREAGIFADKIPRSRLPSFDRSIPKIAHPCVKVRP